ncbi:hypothetical protein DPX16_5772 [Anabarilius grahami]|uniref:Uncharacterized protein n=1 Tax=Anabarilius grahami TaxID=495550 RepID=A0A3N0YUZ9_ANAGA|nr:hypothetical protein DPX16_5772 [Anabarilius grahami]
MQSATDTGEDRTTDPLTNLVDAVRSSLPPPTSSTTPAVTDTIVHAIRQALLHPPTTAASCPSVKEKAPKTDVIQQLTEKLEQLTSTAELMRQSMQTQVEGQFNHNGKGRGDRRREKPYGCDKCMEQNRPDCPHCFHCGEEDELRVYVVNGDVLPFDGWVALTVNLMGNEDSNLSITVPFLVSSLALERPLLGFNVLEEMIQERPEKLISTLVILLCNALCIPAEKAELMVSFIQASKPSVQCGHLRTGRQDMVIPAGQVAWAKCQVPPHMSTSDAVFLFEPDDYNVQLTELDVGEDTQRQADMSDDSENDSDDDSGSEYWLRRPTERIEERPVTYQEQLTRYPEIQGSEPAPVKRKIHTVPEHLPNPTEKRQHADENLPLPTGPVEGEENNGHQDSDSEARPLTPPVEHTQSDVRRSVREKRPRRFLTYESLGLRPLLERLRGVRCHYTVRERPLEAK